MRGGCYQWCGTLAKKPEKKPATVDSAGEQSTVGVGRAEEKGAFWIGWAFRNRGEQTRFLHFGWKLTFSYSARN